MHIKNFNSFMRHCIACLAIMLCTASIALADNKSSYHLFNPTPRELMREMSTDRPDKTESAYTVDAGHYQIELSFFDYTYDHRNLEEDGTRVDQFNYLPFNFKIGLLNNVDLQLVYDSYIVKKVQSAGEKDITPGSGDAQTRLKINLWGNDSGNTALAVMPFIKFPLNTNDLENNDTEGGVIIPLAVSLPKDWSMGLMTEFDFNKREDDDGYYTEFINSITFGHSIVGNLNGYVEFFSSYNNEPDTQWVGTVDGGLTYAVNENIQLDIGVNIGVTRSADDFNPFCGLSMRY